MYKVEVDFGRTIILVVTGTSEFLQQEYFMWYTILCQYLRSIALAHLIPARGGAGEMRCTTLETSMQTEKFGLVTLFSFQILFCLAVRSITLIYTALHSSSRFSTLCDPVKSQGPWIIGLSLLGYISHDICPMLQFSVAT